MVANRQTARKRGAGSARDNRKASDGTLNRPGNSERVDRLVHERTRLSLMSSLAVNKSLTFSELKELLGTSDGNLSVHARKLEDADYVTCTKSFEGRFPKTEYQLTVKGRQALERYLDHMEALIHAMRRA